MKPYVLLTNDDGYKAPGIVSLAEAINDVCRLFVVAPSREHSGKGCSLTMGRQIRTTPVSITGCIKGIAVDGTPVDCVKIALSHILPRVPDLVLSGINAGENAGYTCFYSGTLGAAAEACFNGVPSIAFSVESTRGEYGFEAACTAARKLVSNWHRLNISTDVVLNINIPRSKWDEICGIRLTTQGNLRFLNIFDARHEGDDIYYTMHDDMHEEYAYGNTDSNALKQDFISVTPLRFNLNTHDFAAERCVDILSEMYKEPFQENIT